jgi:hypothetical protein
MVGLSAPLMAQTTKIDPAPLPPGADTAGPSSSPAPTADAPAVPASPGVTSPPGAAGADPAATAGQAGQLAACVNPRRANAAGTDPTYHEDDLIGAAEGVFGKGAKGLAQVIERSLKSQGEPNGYIVGREAAGAFVVGLRYGSGTLCHKVEGQRSAYWTGPSLGFDAGGDATKVFVLVYNLYDTQDLYKRFGEIEGRAYFVGGLSATYLRKNNVVLIPIRLGVGLRAGVNFGYMKIREKRNWVPF